MSADRVEIVHPPTGVRAVVKERVVPGWQRMGWIRADEADNEPEQSGARAGDESIADPTSRRRAAHKLPAPEPGTTDDLAAGSSSHQTEGAQP